MPAINFYPQEVKVLSAAAEKDGIAPAEWFSQGIVESLCELGWLTATHENDDGTITHKITDAGIAAYALWQHQTGRSVPGELSEPVPPPQPPGGTHV